MVAIVKYKSPCDDCPYRKGILIASRNPCTDCKRKLKKVIELPDPGGRRRADSNMESYIESYLDKYMDSDTDESGSDE